MRAALFLWVGGLAAGCATAPKIPAPSFPAGEDGVALMQLTPPSPATLTLGQHLEMKVAYQLASTNAATLYVRPYTAGRQSRNYLGHAPVTCTNGTGVADAWLSFRSEAEVDEIRLILLEEGSRKPLAQQTNTIRAVWSAAP